jgi:hypothetical protein
MPLETRSEFEIACIAIAEHHNHRPPVASFLHHHGWWAARRDHVGALYLELNVSHSVHDSKRSNGLHSCVGAAAAPPSCTTSSLPDEPLHWSDDDDDDERCRSSSPVVAAASSGVSEVELGMTHFVVWSEPYQCPIIYFHAIATPTTTTGSSRTTLRPTVQQLMEWIMPDICDPLQTGSVESSSTTGGGGAFGKPIVSEGFSEELQRALFSVHPCDMSSMLRIAHDVLGEPKIERQGVGNGRTHYEEKKGCRHADIVVRLLRMCGPSIGIPSDCLPQ